MEAQNKFDTRIEYEIPNLSIIALVVGDVILQESLDSEDLEDTEPLDGSWKN